MYFYKKEKVDNTLRLYVRDCNLRCSGCKFHYSSMKNCFSFFDIDFDHIKKVVFVGGEPTNQKLFEHICKELKEKDIEIEIHTNGWFNCVIQTLCEKKLVDKVVEKKIEDPKNTLYEDGLKIFDYEYEGRSYKSEYWALFNHIPFEVEICAKG